MLLLCLSLSRTHTLSLTSGTTKAKLSQINNVEQRKTQINSGALCPLRQQQLKKNNKKKKKPGMRSLFIVVSKSEFISSTFLIITMIKGLGHTVMCF